MEKKIILGKKEVVFIVIAVLCTKVFLNFPRLMEESAGTGAWLQTLYISFLALLGLWIIVKLYRPLEGKDLIDLGEVIGGRVGRIIVGIAVSFYLINILSIVLREFSEDMKVIDFEISPISFVMLFFIGGMVIGGYFGIESVGRIITVSVFVISLGFLAILLGVAPYIDFTNLFPILGNGFSDIFIIGAMKVSVFGELLFVFMLLPFIKSYQQFKSSVFWGAGISSAFLFLSVLVYSLVFAYPMGTEGFLPIYQMARLINYGRFFQRVESFFAFIWILAAFLYLSIGFTIFLNAFQKTFRIKYHRPLIIPFSILIFTLALFPKSLMSAVDLETEYIMNYSFIITFGMTIVLLIAARIVQKKKAGKKN